MQSSIFENKNDVKYNLLILIVDMLMTTIDLSILQYVMTLEKKIENKIYTGK